MYTLLKSSSRQAVALAVVLAVSGCGSTKPIAYSGLASSAKLQPSTDTHSGRVPLEYKTFVNWNAYSGFILDPVTIYQGDDNQFGKVSAQDRDYFAQYMQSHFKEVLSKRFRPATTASHDTLRIKLTLTGAKNSTPGLSTFTHMDIGNLPINTVQATRGKEGTFMGSVSYAVEIYNAATNELLGAYVAKEYPNALNFKATLGKRTAGIVGINKGADHLMSYLQ